MTERRTGKAPRTPSTGYFGSLGDSSWNGVSKDSVGSFDANGVFRLGGGDDKGIEEELEPASGILDEALEPEGEQLSASDSRPELESVSDALDIPVKSQQADSLRQSSLASEDDPVGLFTDIADKSTDSNTLHLPNEGDFDPSSADALWSLPKPTARLSVSPPRQSPDPGSRRKFSVDRTAVGSGDAYGLPRTASPNLFGQQLPMSSAPPQSAPRFVSPDQSKWLYRDPSGTVQGPFSGIDMDQWWKSRFFTLDLPVKREHDASFEPLAVWIRKIGNDQAPFLVPLPAPEQTAPSHSVNPGPALGGWNAPASPSTRQLFGDQHNRQFAPQNSMPNTPASPFAGNFDGAFANSNRDHLASVWAGAVRNQQPGNFFGFENRGVDPDRERMEQQREQHKDMLIMKTRELETAKEYQHHEQQRELSAAGYPSNDMLRRHQQQREDLLRLEHQLQAAKMQFQRRHQPQALPQEMQAHQGVFGGQSMESPYGPPHAPQQQQQWPQDAPAKTPTAVQSPWQSFLGNQTQQRQSEEPGYFGAGAIQQQRQHQREAEVYQQSQSGNITQADQQEMEQITPGLDRLMLHEKLDADHAKARQVTTLVDEIENQEEKYGSEPVRTDDPNDQDSRPDQQHAKAEVSPSAPAPWAKAESGPPKGPSIREIHEMEAKRAEARKEQQRLQAQAQAAASAGSASEEIPGNVSWGIVIPGGKSESPAPTSPAPWSASTSTPPKKTLREIQEEEARQAKARQQREKQAQQAQSSTASSMGTRYADLMVGGGARRPGSGGPSPAATNVGGAGWVTVGSSGKLAAPAPVTNTRPPAGTNGSGAARSVSQTAAASTARATPSTSSSGPSQDFLGWSRNALRGMTGVNVDELLNMFLSMTSDSITPEILEIISDQVYSYHSTLNGRQFAEEFCKRRKADQQAQQKGGSSATGGFAGAVKQPVNKSSEPEWNSAFKVVNNKKSKKPKAQQNYIPGMP